MPAVGQLLGLVERLDVDDGGAVDGRGRRTRRRSPSPAGVATSSSSPVSAPATSSSTAALARSALVRDPRFAARGAGVRRRRRPSCGWRACEPDAWSRGLDGLGGGAGRVARLARVVRVARVARVTRRRPVPLLLPRTRATPRPWPWARWSWPSSSCGAGRGGAGPARSQPGGLRGRRLGVLPGAPVMVVLGGEQRRVVAGGGVVGCHQAVSRQVRCDPHPAGAADTARVRLQSSRRVCDGTEVVSLHPKTVRAGRGPVIECRRRPGRQPLSSS